MTFSGTNIGWVAATGPERGMAEVFIDGSSYGIVDLYSPAETPRYLAFTANGLDAGHEHTIEIVVLSDKNPLSTGRRVEVDALVVIS
jgi:hypothetical protein